MSDWSKRKPCVVEGKQTNSVQMNMNTDRDASPLKKVRFKGPVRNI